MVEIGLQKRHPGIRRMVKRGNSVLANAPEMLVPLISILCIPAAHLPSSRLEWFERYGVLLYVYCGKRMLMPRDWKRKERGKKHSYLSGILRTLYNRDNVLRRLSSIADAAQYRSSDALVPPATSRSFSLCARHENVGPFLFVSSSPSILLVWVFVWT
jgi:hypothetical protein